MSPPLTLPPSPKDSLLSPSPVDPPPLPPSPEDPGAAIASPPVQGCHHLPSHCLPSLQISRREGATAKLLPPPTDPPDLAEGMVLPPGYRRLRQIRPAGAAAFSIADE